MPYNTLASRSDRFLFIMAAVLPFLVYLPTIPGWWISSDDPVLAAFAAEHGFLEYTFNPEVWRQLTNSNLSPLVVWLYDLDLFLFGSDPVKFYVHNLFSCSLLMALSYILFRQFARPWISMLGILLFCLSPAFAHIAHFLMNRHYLEGLFWAMLCFLLFKKSIAQNNLLYAAGCGLCYALAILHKEIYAPLILILILWSFTHSSVSWKRGLKALWPCLTVALAYPLYRFWMLGVLLGGYGTLFDSEARFASALLMTNRLMWPQAPWISLLVLIPAIYGLLVFAKKSISSTLFVLVIVLGTLIPLTQIIPVMSSRHLFLPCFLLFVASFYGVEQFYQKKSRWIKPLLIISLLVISLGVVHSHITARVNIIEHTSTKTVQGRFLWEEAANNDVLLVQGLSSWYVGGLFELSRIVDGRELKGRAIFDLCYYFYVSGPDIIDQTPNILRYDPQTRALVRLDSDYLVKKHQECLSLYRPEMELSAEIFQDGSYVRWELGPFSSGKYALVSPETGSAYTLPAKGHIAGRIDFLLKPPVYVCYAHPDGWHVCDRLTKQNHTYSTR